MWDSTISWRDTFRVLGSIRQSQCPHHQIPDQLLIQYFYEGLMPTDRSIIDVASGGALVDKTPEVARQWISNVAANSKQFGSR